MLIFLLFMIYIAFISLGLPDSLFGVAWPLMHLELALDEGFAAVFMLIIGVCTASVSFVAGPLIRKAGTEWVTAISVLLTAVGMLGIGLSPNIWLMVVFAVMMGIGAGAIDTALNDFVSKHYKARHMSWLHGFWGVGVSLSPLIMSFFLEKGGWRGGYLMMSYIQFGLALIMFLSVPLWKQVKRIHTSQSNVELKDNNLEKQIAIVEKEKEVVEKEKEVAEKQKEVVEKQRGLLEKQEENVEFLKSDKLVAYKQKGVLYAGIALALYCGMEYIVGLWGASYLVNVCFFTPAVAARYISMYYAGIMAGRFLTGLLTIKLNNRVLLRGGSILSVLGFALLLIPDSVVTLIGLLLVGIGYGPIFPTSIDETKNRFNPKYSADIIGFQMGFAYVGAFIAQLSFGYAATRTTWAIFPFMLLTISLCLFVLIELVNYKTKGNIPLESSF